MRSKHDAETMKGFIVELDNNWGGGVCPSERNYEMKGGAGLYGEERMRLGAS